MKSFLILTLLMAVTVMQSAANTKNFDEYDYNISRLLGIRPDLAQDLGTIQIDDNDDNNPTMSGTPVRDQTECINECGPSDQSCRARCLGVPGGSARKMPRKQDIDGNLPLNWRKPKGGNGLAGDNIKSDSNSNVHIFWFTLAAWCFVLP